jgi:hypothetical protein
MFWKHCSNSAGLDAWLAAGLPLERPDPKI